MLAGGVANAGAVLRSGGRVLRPANPHSASIHRFLAHLRAAGFEGRVRARQDRPQRTRAAGLPRGRSARAALSAVGADRHHARVSMAALMRQLRRGSPRALDMAEAAWSTEMADPDIDSAAGATAEGGLVVCHNDVCLENVVFHDGAAVGLLDFDFAAPGRRGYDLAQMARMCAPVDDPLDAARVGWQPSITAPSGSGWWPARVRARGGWTAALLDRARPLDSRGGEFVRRRVEAGEAAFEWRCGSRWGAWPASTAGGSGGPA